MVRAYLRSFPVRVFFILILFSSAAYACSCAGPRSFGGKNFQPCGVFWGVDAVFIGKVEKVSTESNRLIAHFSVEKAIRGISERTIDVETSPSTASCGYPFKEGETYFAYLRRGKNGKYSEMLCGATVPLAKAEHDLEYLKAVESGEKGGRVFGYVSRIIQASPKDRISKVGLESVRIQLESVKVGGDVPRGAPKYVKRKYETLTDKDGYYIFYGIPDGSYHVTADTPTPLRRIVNSDLYPAFIELAENGRRCGGAGFVTTSLSSLEGKALNFDGSLPPQQYIHLLPIADDGTVNSDSTYASSWINGQTGGYYFDHVAPGRYLVAINPRNCPGPYAPQYGPSYFPGTSDKSAAKVISVKEAERLKLDEYKLPPVLKERTFSGIVRSADGALASGAKVFLSDANVSRCMNLGNQRQVVAGQDGRFSISGFDGYEYRLRAYKDNQPTASKRIFSKTVEIPASQNIANLELILNNPY